MIQMKLLLKQSFKPLLVLLAAVALLVQCFGGLSASTVSVIDKQGLHFNDAFHGELAVVHSQASLDHSASLESSAAADSDLSVRGMSDNEMPAMSCCEDESQPITLAELQLLPLIFLLGLIAVVISITRTLKPQAPFLSPRRLHKLHCCWLN